MYCLLFLFFEKNNVMGPPEKILNFTQPGGQLQNPAFWLATQTRAVSVT